MNQVQQIPFTVGEKNQAMSLRGCVRLYDERDIFCLQGLIGGVEIGHGDGHVTQAGMVHLLRRTRMFAAGTIFRI